MSSQPYRRPRLPDFFIAGVPKAGTTALHAALSSHPRLSMSAVKEPKFFLCDGHPPWPRHGPGDAHSVKEWIWRRSDYERLFEGSDDALRGESTPFYLYDPAASARIAELVPQAKFIVVVRDPIDRAYSNWLHLWSDGLEPIDRFDQACAAEPERIANAWAPFWHYQNLGRYGQQLQNLLMHFPRSDVLLLRYRDLVDSPSATLDRICVFLGVERGLIQSAPPENVRGLVVNSSRNRMLARTIRAGARVGSRLPPQVWRAASAPLVSARQARSLPRPQLDVDIRRQLVGQYREDIALLERLTGEPFSDWLRDTGRGAFADRQPAAHLSRAADPV